MDENWHFLKTSVLNLTSYRTPPAAEDRVFLVPRTFSQAVYIDKDGNVLEKKQKGVIEMIVSFFMFIYLFFCSLLGFSSPNNRRSNAQDYRNIVRGGGVGGTGGNGNAYRRNGGGGGGRDIGRLPSASGIAPPPMSGGCCGGGGCG